MSSEAARDWRVRWRLFTSELVGTALLVFGGVSVVIVMFGDGSPMARLVPNEMLRTTLTAFPFGTVGLVPLEAHISGTSTNPARTFGPALISGRWDGWWIYWLGPMVGMLIAIASCSSLARRIEVAKLYHLRGVRWACYHPGRRPCGGLRSA